MFQALIVGGVFINSPEATAAYFSRGGVLFLYVHATYMVEALLDRNLCSALLFSALTAMSEIPALYAQRPIILRHKHAAFYHPFIEGLALTLVDIPITFITSVVFGVILYFMVGLQRSAVSSFQRIAAR